MRLVLGFMLVRWIQVSPRFASAVATRSSGSSRPNVEDSKQDPSLIRRDRTNFGCSRATGSHRRRMPMGLLYSQGDENTHITQDQSRGGSTGGLHEGGRRAFRSAAVPNTNCRPAYWDGHGVPKDANKAYLLGCAGVRRRKAGQQGSRQSSANGNKPNTSRSYRTASRDWHQAARVACEGQSLAVSGPDPISTRSVK